MRPVVMSAIFVWWVIDPLKHPLKSRPKEGTTFGCVIRHGGMPVSRLGAWESPSSPFHTLPLGIRFRCWASSPYIPAHLDLITDNSPPLISLSFNVNVSPELQCQPLELPQTYHLEQQHTQPRKIFRALLYCLPARVSRGTIHTLIDIHDPSQDNVPTRVSLQRSAYLTRTWRKKNKWMPRQTSECGWSAHEGDHWERRYVGSRPNPETSCQRRFWSCLHKEARAGPPDCTLIQGVTKMLVWITSLQHSWNVAGNGLGNESCL